MAAGQEYAEKALKFLKDAGVKDKSAPVIKKMENPSEWAEWLDYYHLKGLHFSVELMETRTEKTVPCLSPIDFDAGYRPIPPPARRLGYRED